jgi:hypothetical protein
MKKISPSKLELVSRCPASPRLCEPFPFVSNQYSERGNLLHAITANILEGMDRNHINGYSDLPEKDLDAVEMCIEVAKKFKPAGKHEMYIEHKMDLSFLAMGSGGKADLAYYDHASGFICVIDWKFGSTVIDNMKQLVSYGLGLKEEIAPLPCNGLFLVACQPQETMEKSLTTQIVKKDAFAEWENDIQKWVSLAMNPKAKALAGPWCTRCFCEASKNAGACPAFEEMKNAKAEKKETEHQAEVSSAVSGFNPIIVTSELPALPLVVLDQRTIEKAEDYRAQALLPVTDQSTADAMGLLLNEITKFEGLVDANRSAVKRPFLDLNKAIDDAAKKALNPLLEAKAQAKIKLNTWIAEQSKKASEAQAEFEQKKKEAEAQGTPIEVPAPVVEAPKPIAGTKTNRVPKWSVKAFKEMPDDFKITDERTLLAAIKAKKWGNGTEAPSWLEVKWEDEIASNGRKK